MEQIIATINMNQKLQSKEINEEQATKDYIEPIYDEKILNTAVMLFELGIKLNELRLVYEKTTDINTRRNLYAQTNGIMNSIQVMTARLAALK